MQSLTRSIEHDPLVTTGEPDAARPYGLIGLAVSFVLILVASLVLTALAAGAAFAIAGVALGWDELVRHLESLRGVIESNLEVLQRVGVVLSVVVYIAISLAVLAAARWRGGRLWRSLLGWRPWHPTRGARLFWIVTGATIVYGFGADALVSKFYPPSHEWVRLPSGQGWVALFVVLAVVLAPLTEELLFRGWLYTGLRLKIRVWPAIVVTSVLFAAAHWEKTHLYALIVFPVGLMLGFIRERTGSLLASMSLHALFNGAASLALLFGG